MPTKAKPPAAASSGPCPHIVIQSVQPALDAGRYPVKRAVGGPCAVEATIFRDGHATIRAVVKWRHRNEKTYHEIPMDLVNPGMDLWRAQIIFERNDKYFFTIEAWTDFFATWLADFKKRVDARQGVRSEALEGAALIEKIAGNASGADRALLMDAAKALRSKGGDAAAAIAVAAHDKLIDCINRLQPREDAVVHQPELAVVADRERALFGAWYEMFPRSQGTVPNCPSTLKEAQRRLPDIRKMGFDVLYLPPVHPIGLAHRKGRNNSLKAGPSDPGCPWAIGNKAGGHDALDPNLGTMNDFDAFVAAARKQSLEIALDFALQCSPDHPWVQDHPEWFYRRPDGTIKYAENPPKKYEDIYPLNFDTADREALWQEIRRLFEFWIGHGVKIFRVDNPHTKPPCFWEWLLDDITRSHPEVFFLAEAFTRPPMMKTLSKLGFTQSYSYFNWRNTKWELHDYLTELTQTEMREYFRPNLFTNTPDILQTILVHGGRPAFKMRLVLAATLSPSYGIYSGYELCENEFIPHHAIPGDVEYANSEKYEIRVRNWDAPGNIKDLVVLLNRIRNDNSAFKHLGNLRFHETESEDLLCYSKCTPDGSNRIIVIVNLDPFHVREGVTRLNLELLGLAPDRPFRVKDLISGATWTWRGAANYVKLDPSVEPAHILRIE